MRFPLKEAMTPEQRRINEEAKGILVRGKYYRFTPPVTATAVPTGGPNTCCALEECTFERGKYIGFKKGNHVFLGKPVNDQRVIPTPQRFVEQIRDSYFHVLFIGGSVAALDADQSHRKKD